MMMIIMINMISMIFIVNVILSAVILSLVTEQKNYAFSPGSSTQLSSAAVNTGSDGLVEVKLSSELEEAMLDLIRKEMSTASAIGHVSQRLNARKLTVGFYRSAVGHLSSKLPECGCPFGHRGTKIVQKVGK